MKQLTRYIAGCGRNIWAYPPLSDPDHLHRVGLREAVKRAAAELPPGGVVADLGCGWMPYKEWFETDGRTYIPLDVTGYPDHRFRLIREGRLPLPSESVDILVCWQVLEHVHDMQSFFTEVKRVLRPGAPAFFTTHGLFRIHDCEDFWRWTPMGLRLLFEEQGFTDFQAAACDTTFAITASLINQAVRPRRNGLMKRAIYRTLSASINSIGLAADRLCASLGFTGHRREASTYLIKVRNSRSAVEAQAVDGIRIVSTSPSISVCVAICTRNRATELARVLEGLEDLKYPSELLQVSIIDNGSTDQTQQIAEAWCARRTNAVYLRETRAGLPFARNRAWQETGAELVAYIDDDAIPERDWLEQLAEAYRVEKGRSPSPCLALGGRVKLSLPDEKPDTQSWLGPNMLGWLSQLDYGPDTFVLDKPLMHLMGANFSVPRDTLEQIGGFAEDMPGYGGDERYVEGRIRSAGGRLIYVGSAVVHHQIGPDKLTREWFRSRLLAEGKAVAHLRMREPQYRIARTLKTCVQGLRSMVYGLAGTVREKSDPSPVNFWHSCQLWYARGLLGETTRLWLLRAR
jgi:GT2 family glycosyltransferase/SAM-dependent methyltransferase